MGIVKRRLKDLETPKYISMEFGMSNGVWYKQVYISQWKQENLLMLVE